ncbi:MAG: hypothetical protein PVF71_09215, partial [Desulfobacterales bacterium]
NVFAPARIDGFGAERIDGYVRNLTCTQLRKQTLFSPGVHLRCCLGFRLCKQHSIIISTASAEQARSSKTL